MPMDDEKRDLIPTESGTDNQDAANTRSHADLIGAQYDAYRKQQDQSIDRQTGQEIRQAVRDYQDVRPEYQEQFRRQTADMYQEMDNEALEARLEGAYGGMATARVGAIHSGYQQQRQALSLRQEELAADTLRTIGELRAKGEFDKADALLQSRQMELKALYDEAVRLDDNQWSNDQYDESAMREEQQDSRKYLRSMGQAFLDAGVMPSEEMLEAMNLSREMARSYVNAVLNGY